MRTRLIMMSLVALAGAATPASAASLRAQRVATGASPVGQADATTFAYSVDRADDGSVVLRGDDGRARTVAAPAGCRISAAQNALLAGQCGEGEADPSTPGGYRRHLFVARLDGSLVTRLDAVVQAGADGSVPSPPSSVGAQWIGSLNAEYHGGEWPEAVNWHTGAVRESTQDAARTVDDLNAPDLQAPLCAPLRRVRHADDVFGSAPGYFSAEVHGRYVLLEHADGRFTVRRCGSARAVRLPKGFFALSLGSGWVAGATKVHGRFRIGVVRLAGGRRLTVAGLAPKELPDLALTRGRLYVSGVDFTHNPLYAVRLPR